MRYVFPLALALLSLCGCAANIEDIYLSGPIEEHLRQVNREMGKRTVHLVLRGGRSFAARDAIVMSDSTFWRDPDSRKEIAVSTAEVHRITYKNRKKGALRGLVIGALIGLPGGALVSDSPPGSNNNIVIDRIQAAFGGALSGALWGVGIGALAGRQTTYFFHLPTDGKTSPAGP